MISDEAVEAAAKAVEDQTSTWLYPVVGSNAEDIVRAALEAAAPNLTKAAWEDGYGHGYKHGYSDCLKQNGYDDEPV